MYDCMIKPIIIYGSEVWGQQFYTHFQNNLKIIESIEFKKLQSKICKQLLGVGKFTSKLAARAELGRIPLCFEIMKCILKYWIIRQNSCHFVKFFTSKDINMLKNLSDYIKDAFAKRGHMQMMLQMGEHLCSLIFMSK